MPAPQELDLQPSEASFRAYSDLLRPLNESHPQHQGLLREEFGEAFQSPRVIKTQIEVDGERVSLPQLAPVSAYGWLHTQFYDNRFPAEFAGDQLLHFSDLPGVEPGAAVNERLTELAERRGVLVFDFPSNDPLQPARILSHLDSLGIRADKPDDPAATGIDYIEDSNTKLASVALLGTQTYHAGRGILKREHLARDPHLTYAQAFEEMVKLGEIPPEQFVNGVSMHEIIEGDEAAVLQQFYDEAYKTIGNHPCEQGLSPDEFAKKLLDRGTAKAVCRRDGVAESLCLVTENLADLTWVNEPYYRTPEFIDRFGDGPVTWFPGIATNPHTAATNLWKISKLFSTLSERGDNRTLIVFDTPDINTGLLDVALERMINRAPETRIKFVRIADQKYCATRLALAA